MNIKSIQKELKSSGINARLFTMGNLFINEDILPEENRIFELTKFSGSYGILLITITKAYLFVDGRYEIQAKKEVNPRLVEIIKLSETPFITWLKKNLGKTSTKISYNPWIISAQTLQELQTTLPKSQFIPISNPDKLLSSNKIKTFPHQKRFTGLTSKEKLSQILKYIKHYSLDAYLITSPSNASWLLNTRSNALPFSPIFRAYVLVEKNGSYKVFAEHSDYPNALPFNKLEQHLSQYKDIGADFCSMPSKISEFAPNIQNITDKITELKSIKNKTELKGISNAHIRDGVALSKFLFWLSKNYKGKTETEIAEKLLTFRKKELNFYSESFETIAGFGLNGAIVHYHAQEKTAATLKKDSILLLDSGGQYYDGTTDVTRTIALGTPSRDMIEKNTLVLKSHIALASAVFPKNTSGKTLDLLARQILLKNNLNFEHGTGHGVGFFSNVHEGPARISPLSNTPLQASQVTSIEPGYYKENSFGIRIENLYYIKHAKNAKYLSFEVLTLAPIDSKLIDKYLLSPEELSWLNNYHKKVFQSLKKYLTKQELEWLKEACAPL